MKPRHRLLLLLLLLAAHLTGCRSARPTDERPPAAAVFSSTRDASTSTPKMGSESMNSNAKSALNAQKKPITDASTRKPAFFLSTPEGSARRQARKDAKAAVPRFIGKGAVYAPLATEVVNAYKPRAAVVNADSGAIVTAIGKNKASAATAPHATASTTVEKPGFPWLRVGFGFGAFGLLVLLLATPAGPWLLGLFRRRQRPA